MRTIAIIILNFNGTENTNECLKSISRQFLKEIKLKVFIIDNGSKEKFKLNKEAAMSESAEVIRSEKNLGFSGGNNLGIKKALKYNPDYVLFLNNDTILDEKTIMGLTNCLENNKNAGVASPKIYFAKGFEYHKNRYKEKDFGRVIWYAGGIIDWNNITGFHRGVDEVDCGQFDKEEVTDFASGCCMMVKKEVIEKVGFFDEKYFLYYEDTDYIQRIKKNGYKIIFYPKAILWHKNAASSGSGSLLHDYFLTRNRLIFGFKYASLRSKLTLLKESLKIFSSGRKWQKKGVLDFYLRKFGKGSYE